jgi:hypothetical protein
MKRAKGQALAAIQKFEAAQSKWAIQEWTRAVREHRIGGKTTEGLT